MGMKRLTALLFLCIFLIGCGLIPNETVTETSFEYGSSSGDVPSGESAVVDWVIDGDTVDVIMDGEEYRVRYIGMDTPERGDAFYDEAKQANMDLVKGETIIMVKDVSETDRHGRLLRYIYLEDGTFVNGALVAEGFARVSTFPPDVAESDYLKSLQEDARVNGRGLWGGNELSGAPAGCATCVKNAYNCADFSSQNDAQACYEFCMDSVGEDIHHLDGGGDGMVCESLP